MPRGGPDVALRLDEFSPDSSLPALLSALTPGGVPALQRLSLFGCCFSPAVLVRCSALAAVTELHLDCCDAEDGDWEAICQALLRQAPLLSSLLIEEHTLSGELPLALVAHTGLRSLALIDNYLKTLPAGPYLASLQQLSFDDESLLQPELPPALAAATALTSLEVPRNLWPDDSRPLSTDGMAAVLSQLPQLGCLKLALRLECSAIARLARHISPAVSGPWQQCVHCSASRVAAGSLAAAAQPEPQPAAAPHIPAARGPAVPPATARGAGLDRSGAGGAADLFAHRQVAINVTTHSSSSHSRG